MATAPQKFGSISMAKKSLACEICKSDNPDSLHTHHIIPQCDPRCTNDPSNLVTLCANCHQLIHKNKIIAEGWLDTTAGKKFFFHKEGEQPIARGGFIFQPDGKVKIEWT